MRHAQAGAEYHGPGVPRSSFYDSPFGRMFSKIPPWEPESDLAATVRSEFEAYADAHMIDDGDPAGDNEFIPAGYTYFGQFVDHDITFDPTTSLMRHNDPNKHRNFRTPRLDLDSVYGAGPDASPHLYTNFGYFLIGTGEFKGERDLPRNEAGTALIGDPRNDENIIVSRVQLAFLLFHNKVLEHLVGDATSRPSPAQFREAQRIVRWTYQYIVWNDFVKRLVSKTVWADTLKEHDLGLLKSRRLYYQWKQSPYIPIEFSVAAYRLGHAMVRDGYQINNTSGFGLGFQVEKPIFALGGDTDPALDLRGGRRLPSHHSLQWDWFLDFAPVDPANRGIFPQLARRFNRKLGAGVHNIPTPEGPVHLGVLNLLRGWRMGLPSGSAIADYMGISNAMAPTEPIDDCLWPFILKEASLEASVGGSGGIELGSVGSRIVAEVFAGLLVGDPSSYAALHPEWTPAKDLAPLFSSTPIQGGDDWTLADVIEITGLPITDDDIRALDTVIDLTSTGVVTTTP